MAQDFRNDIQRNVGATPQLLVDAGDYDAVIGIRCCNIGKCCIVWRQRCWW